jgi:lipoyl-dependent peroxiredoxin subunit D
MTIDARLDSFPDYASDLKLNFTSVVRNQTELTAQQAWGTVVASAMVSHNHDLIAAAMEEAAMRLSPQALAAAKAAAAIMSMNNIYYRFRHLTTNTKYAAMRSGLRMNVMRTHGVEPPDFELWCTAVSAINNCAACVDSHEKALRENGMSEEKILAAIRIAAVIHAIAVVMDAERAMAAEPAMV